MAVASTIAAAMYKAQRDAARASERQANVHLLESLIAQADASRRGNRSGQRVHTIEILQRAAAMADRLGVTKLDDRIRDLAIAAIGLPDIAVGRRLPGVVPLGCWGAVVDDTMSRYAVADAAGTLTIRRVDDNAEIGRLPVTGDSDLTFGPGGRFLGMWTRSPGLLTVWDVDAGPPRKVVEQTGVRSPLFHPDGRSLVVVTGQGDVLVFELPSGRRTASHPAVALTREVTIALHPRQPWIALCSYFHERVLVRHLGSGAVIAELPFSGYSTPWSADGRWLAVTGGDELTIRVVDTRTWQVVRTLESPTGGMIARFDPTGQFIVGYGWDGSFRAWDRTGTRQAFATPISGSHCRLGFARDGRTFAQTRDDSDLCCWEVHAGAERREFRPAGRLNERLTGMFAIHPAGRLFAVGGVRGLQFWDLATGEELPAVVPGENVYAPAFCEHEFMCWGSFPSKVWRFPALTSNDANGFRFGPPECVSDFSAALSVSRDGRVTTLQCRPVAATQNFAGVWIRRSDGPARPVHIPCRGEHERSVVSPDGRLAVIGVVGPNNLQVVDTRDGRPLKSLDVSGYFSNAAFAGDGRMLVTMGDRLTVWHTGPDIADWRRGPEIESPCAAADVHPGLPIIASSKPDGIVRLHDSNTGEEIACLEAPEAAGQVAFSPDGARLCVLHSGGSVSSWELARLGRELRRVGLDRGTTPFPNCPEPKDGPDAEPLRVEFTGLWQMQPELAIVAGMVRSLGRPTDQTLRELGRGLARLRAYPLSRAAYEALTRRRPDDAEAAYELGLAAVERRDWSTALDRLRLAASDPQLHDVARLVRAALLRHINRPAEADAEVQSLRAVNGLDSVAYYSEAAAFLDEARFGPAALLFEEAHRRAPGEGLYLMNGALLWLAAPPPWGDPAKALAWAQRATEKNANRSRSQWAAGLALLKHGRLTEASLTLNQLRAHGEADYVAGALYALAQVHDRRGDRPAAAACWHEAEAKYPAARVTALLGLPPSVVRSIESARRGAAAALNQAPAPNPP
jgi:WD40 repeat protein/tetratricopeptide (TPR) repeat protein